MKYTIIIYQGMLFASPRHLMNYFRVNNVVNDIDTKLLTMYVYKGIETVKGIKLSYRHYDTDKNPEFEDVYNRIKSLTRSGKGYIMGMTTPVDYYENVIKPLLDLPVNPVKAAIERAVEQGIGTEKDFKDLIKGDEQNEQGENN